MNPLGIAALPGEIVAHLRVLPRIAERLTAVARHTEGIRDNTDLLERVASDTQALSSMDERMATIEEAMPVLVEVQQHLAQLPETINRLEDGIERLCLLMEGLQESLQPIGRVAEKIPGQRRAARQ